MPQVWVPDPERTGSYLICATPRTGSSLLCGLLGLDLPAGREITIRHKRLADELNARWIESYHRYESGRGA